MKNGRPSGPSPPKKIMTLKNKFATKQEIPAEHQSLYLEQAGEWVLDHDGRAKIEEFRANNIALTNQLKRFEGIDPEAVRKTAEEKRKLEEAAQLQAGEFEKVLAARVKAERAGWDKNIAPKLAELDSVNAQLSAVRIDDAVLNEALKRGLRPTARLDLTARARAIFRMVNGHPQAFDGDTPLMGKDGVTPLTLAEWVDALVSDAPHLFEANAGSGAAGSGGGATGSVSARGARNPYKAETFNLTEQMKLLKSDPKLAARLKAAA